MAYQEIEIILSRQLAEYLSVPVFIVDPEGNLIFYNVPAEIILGQKFGDTGPMTVHEWSNMFYPEYDDGSSFPAEELPLIKTLKERSLFHGQFWIRNYNRVRHKISVSSFPILSSSNRFLGGMAVFKSDQSI